MRRPWHTGVVLGVAVVLSTVFSTVLPTALHGDEDPSFVQGLEAPTTYELSDIDAVNVYNGALSLQIPLGIEYPVGPSLGYSFVLNYNSNFWTFTEIGDDPGQVGAEAVDCR